MTNGPQYKMAALLFPIREKMTIRGYPLSVAICSVFVPLVRFTSTVSVIGGRKAGENAPTRTTHEWTNIGALSSLHYTLGARR